MIRDIRLLTDPFLPGASVDGFAAACGDCGAVVSFVGKVRADQGVEMLELIHYPRLTLPGIEQLAAAALARWPLAGLLVHHRIGRLIRGEPIVLVAAAARHRREAFEAADFVMDHLKSRSWFWKREKRADGWHWIEPRPADHGDAARWDQGA